jgi:hypothetical protein
MMNRWTARLAHDVLRYSARCAVVQDCQIAGHAAQRQRMLSGGPASMRAVMPEVHCRKLMPGRARATQRHGQRPGPSGACPRPGFAQWTRPIEPAPNGAKASAAPRRTASARLSPRHTHPPFQRSACRTTGTGTIPQFSVIHSHTPSGALRQTPDLLAASKSPSPVCPNPRYGHHCMSGRRARQPELPLDLPLQSGLTIGQAFEFYL